MAIKTARTAESGQPQIDDDVCTVCGLCTEICPTDTLYLQDGHVAIKLQTDFGCIGCGQCMAVCPSGAVTVSGREISPDDVVELAATEMRASAAQLEALMRARRSIRHFDNREVEPVMIERIIEMASTAPIGIPPSDVEILVFAGRRKVQAFARDINQLFRNALNFFTPWRLLVMRPFMGRATIEVMQNLVLPLCRGILRAREQGRDVLLYNAPLAMLFHSSSSSDPADALIVATYAMLAAESLGLGTCAIGTVAPFMARSRPTLEKYGIAANNKLGIMLVAGYPQHKFQRGLRRSFASVKYWDEQPEAGP